MTNSKRLNRPHDLTYSLAPDLEIIPLHEEECLCHSSTRSSLIRGPSARLLVEQVMPLLGAGCRWSRLRTLLPAIEPGDLRRALDGLVSGGVLRSSQGPPPASEPALSPLLAVLDKLHLPTEVALSRLASARIAILGLEGAGAYLALLLARSGFRRLVLVDPFPCQPGNLPLMPIGWTEAVGQPRQALVAAALRELSLHTQGLDLALGPPSLSPEYVWQLVSESECVVSCFDRGFAAIHHWVNRACLRAGVPAIYAEAAGHQGWIGPLVLPHRTACYMCLRMRSVACAADSTAAIAYERHLDRQDLPRLHSRPVLPGLMPQLAGVLATSVLQVVLGLEQPLLAGRVLEIHALTQATASHSVLMQPDCPDCGAGGPPGPDQPPLADLLARGDHPVDVLQLASDLISPQTGIVREARWYGKDPQDPPLPYIYKVTLANHRYQSEPTEDDQTCWGKGLTHEDARASGLGEAIERYAGDFVHPQAVVYARRRNLDGPSLDPADLVLYAPDQYAALPYHPYEETSVLGWVRGRSLVRGQPVYLPATAVFMGYQPQYPEEYLFTVTSNGLAAGPSLTRAILSAAYEVLERDAFMIAWFARLPTRRVDPFSHPDPAIRALCQSHRRRGVEIGLWRLPTDHPCAVFLALGLQQPTGQAPAVIAALGADLNPAAAARKAVLEVGQIRPSYKRSLRRPGVQQRIANLVEDPRRVASMLDHALLYCSPAMLPVLAFLLDRAPEPADWSQPDAGCATTQLERLVTHFQAAGGDLLYYNLTPPDIAGLGLAAARVIIPGFQPVSFGARELRLGGSRLYELPRQLGLTPTRLNREDLNPFPHPFD